MEILNKEMDRRKVMKDGLLALLGISTAGTLISGCSNYLEGNIHNLSTDTNTNYHLKKLASMPLYGNTYFFWTCPENVQSGLPFTMTKVRGVYRETDLDRKQKPRKEVLYSLERTNREFLSVTGIDQNGNRVSVGKSQREFKGDKIVNTKNDCVEDLRSIGIVKEIAGKKYIILPIIPEDKEEYDSGNNVYFEKRFNLWISPVEEIGCDTSELTDQIKIRNRNYFFRPIRID